MATIKGFFSSDQLNACGINGPSSSECEECQLYQKCKNPRMSYIGNGKKKILIIGSFPSAGADSIGKPFSGEAGDFLRERIKGKGIDIDEDCWMMDSIGCYPGKNDKGKTIEIKRKEIKCCQPRVNKVIADLKPLHIWLFGDEAITSYFMERESTTTSTRFRGLCIPDPDKEVWVSCTYHPLDIIKKEKDDHLKATFDRDLTFLVKCSKFQEKPEKPVLNKCITILKDFEDVKRELLKVLELKPKKFALDYETTGKKPYRRDHKIATISFCYGYDKAFAFPYQYRNHFTANQIEEICDLWIQILLDPKIKKIAHNSKFEDMWTREILGIDIVNLWWCTKNAAHIWDNRSDYSGLKFQAMIRWGVPDYDAKIEKYLKSDSKDNPFNKVMDAPLNDLLLYNGIDSLLTYRLQDEQEEDFLPYPNFERARSFVMKGLQTLCDIQENGITMDKQYYLDQDVILTKTITDMKARLYQFPEVKKFEQIKHRPINFGSDYDLRELFFDILKLTPKKMTAGDKASTDASVLASLDTPIAKEITKISQLEKIQGTYLRQFFREIDDDGKMRPFFDFHIPTTYRGSSSNPNFQNIPIRDEEAKRITRSGIMPSIIAEYLGIEGYIGNKLLDWDYGAMEVRIIACYTQCPVLMNYIFDESTDMHRDNAIELFNFHDTWQLIPGKLGKKIRFEAKNGFTFPEFYGSYYRSCARNLFQKCMGMICYDGITVLEHLRATGIIKDKNKAYEEFEEWVKRVEQRFWLKYKAVKKWQEKAWSDYLRLGYVEQMFGFRCQGYMTRNDVVNYPIQGTAFHCLMWSINEINRRMKEQRMLSKMIGQIHDCCLSDLFPFEQRKLMDMSAKIATQEIREVNKWINVPLIIEWEETEINKPWGSKIEIEDND